MSNEQVDFEKWARGQGLNCTRAAHDPASYAFAPAVAAWACWQYLTHRHALEKL